MMKSIKNYRIFVFFILLLSVSCKKDPDAPIEPLPVTGSVILHFQNKVGDSLLILNSKQYVNANNDTFTVSKFDYYISNIKLIRNDLSVYSESESYYLLKANASGSLDITLSNVPLGTYTGIEFLIGVDSTRNVSGAQTGALDPANGMFWSWSTGYIMTKFEGLTAGGDGLEFHIGGFTGVNSVLRTAAPVFNSYSAIVSETAVPEINLDADLAEWFATPTLIDFATTNSVNMAGASAKIIADNYADMFSVVSIEN